MDVFEERCRDVIIRYLSIGAPLLSKMFSYYYYNTLSLQCTIRGFDFDRILMLLNYF